MNYYGSKFPSARNNEDNIPDTEWYYRPAISSNEISRRKYFPNSQHYVKCSRNANPYHAHCNREEFSLNEYGWSPRKNGPSRMVGYSKNISSFSQPITPDYAVHYNTTSPKERCVTQFTYHNVFNNQHNETENAIVTMGNVYEQSGHNWCPSRIKIGVNSFSAGELSQGNNQFIQMENLNNFHQNSTEWHRDNFQFPEIFHSNQNAVIHSHDQTIHDNSSSFCNDINYLELSVSKSEKLALSTGISMPADLTVPEISLASKSIAANNSFESTSNMPNPCIQSLNFDEEFEKALTSTDENSISEYFLKHLYEIQNSESQVSDSLTATNTLPDYYKSDSATKIKNNLLPNPPEETSSCKTAANKKNSTNLSTHTNSKKLLADSKIKEKPSGTISNYPIVSSDLKELDFADENVLTDTNENKKLSKGNSNNSILPDIKGKKSDDLETINLLNILNSSPLSLVNALESDAYQQESFISPTENKSVGKIEYKTDEIKHLKEDAILLTLDDLTNGNISLDELYETDADEFIPLLNTEKDVSKDKEKKKCSHEAKESCLVGETIMNSSSCSDRPNNMNNENVINELNQTSHKLHCDVSTQTSAIDDFPAHNKDSTQTSVENCKNRRDSQIQCGFPNTCMIGHAQTLLQEIGILRNKHLGILKKTLDTFIGIVGANEANKYEKPCWKCQTRQANDLLEKENRTNSENPSVSENSNTAEITAIRNNLNPERTDESKTMLETNAISPQEENHRTVKRKLNFSNKNRQGASDNKKTGIRTIIETSKRNVSKVEQPTTSKKDVIESEILKENSLIEQNKEPETISRISKEHSQVDNNDDTSSKKTDKTLKRKHFECLKGYEQDIRVNKKICTHYVTNTEIKNAEEIGKCKSLMDNLKLYQTKDKRKKSREVKAIKIKDCTSPKDEEQNISGIKKVCSHNKVNTPKDNINKSKKSNVTSNSSNSSIKQEIDDETNFDEKSIVLNRNLNQPPEKYREKLRIKIYKIPTNENFEILQEEDQDITDDKIVDIDYEPKIRSQKEENINVISLKRRMQENSNPFKKSLFGALKTEADETHENENINSSKMESNVSDNKKMRSPHLTKTPISSEKTLRRSPRLKKKCQSVWNN